MSRGFWLTFLIYIFCLTLLAMGLVALAKTL